MATPKGLEPYKTVRGFMLMITKQGKLLHISENASDYLGYSVEEVMCQGDSIYDLVDFRDHRLVQAELGVGPPSVFDSEFAEDRAFVCRMNLSRTAKRQIQHYKVIAVEGRYIHPDEYYKTVNAIGPVHPPFQPIFAAYCTPLLGPDNAESMSQGNTEIFCSTHTLDMNFVELDEIGAERLGLTVEQVGQLNWYDLIHPDQLPAFADRHNLLCHERDGSVVCLSRLEGDFGEWIWLHSVLTIKSDGPFDGLMSRSLIHGVHQIFSDAYAQSLQNSPWIYARKHYENFGDQPVDRRSSPDSTSHRFGVPETAGAQIRVSIPTHSYQFSPLDPNNNPRADVKLEVHSLLTPDLSSFHSDSTHSGAARSLCLENLLYDSELFDHSLPELGHELEEYFRQVEQQELSPSTSFNGHSREPKDKTPRSRGIKREFSPTTSIWGSQTSDSWLPFPVQLPSVHSLGLEVDSHFPAKRHRAPVHFFSANSDSESKDAENNNNNVLSMAI